MANQLLSFCPPRNLVGILFAALTALFSASPAHATVFDRGGGLIYDDVLDVTWAQDAFLWGQTGTWFEALAWADSLEFGGFDDWRLPNMDRNNDDDFANCANDSESECRDNEYGYMYYYNLGGTVGDDLTGD